MSLRTPIGLPTGWSMSTEVRAAEGLVERGTFPDASATQGDPLERHAVPILEGADRAATEIETALAADPPTSFTHFMSYSTA